MPELARDFARALDPVHVMTDAGLEPDDWQAQTLRSDQPNHLLLCSRQSGKSTTCAGIACHQAIYDPGLILMGAPAQRQASELFRKAKEIYGSLPGAPRIVQESALSMELANGSRLIAIPGNERTVRSYSSVKLFLLDEASRIEDEFIAAVRPMLAVSQGRMLALTTPYGKRGWFYEQWSDGEGWQRTKITANECPRISPEWLEAERAYIGDWLFRQEYQCEFVDTEEQFFSSALIEAAMTDEFEPIWA